jgi:4-hydroxy-3-methylbut-2-en-1-yl diphosphate reductase
MAAAQHPTCETWPPPAAGVRQPLRVVLAAPRGFCAGVRRAIEAVEAAIERHGAPVYVRRAIVHNLAVVRDLEAKGAVFVQEASDVPPGGVLILSAHGVAASVAREARTEARRVIDATCPLVAKVHREVIRHHRDRRRIVLIGHAGHPEIEGTLGQLPGGAAELIASRDDVDRLGWSPETPLAYAIQTTFSVEDAEAIVARLEARFRDIAGPQGSDICYATTNRQAALRAIAREVDAVIVVGESFSSNANRLAEVARDEGRPVQLVAEPADLDWTILRDSRSIAVTAAASTPESSVLAILATLGRRFDVALDEVDAARERARFQAVRIA